MVSICWLLTQGDRIAEQSYFVVKPNGFEISPEAQAIHGISTENALADGVDITEVVRELKKSIEHVHTFVSYNIEFDLGVLLSELHRLGQRKTIKTISSKHAVCCMKKAQAYLGLDKSPRLGEAYQKICGAPLKGAHHAATDAIACFKCYNAMFPLSRDVFFVKNRRVELTPEQSAIVFAPLNLNIAVLASAGSGKTTTVTARIKHLIDSGVPERSIVLTTFTRDSAADMKRKLQDILGYKPDMTIGTIDTIAKIATFYAQRDERRELKDVGEHATDYLEHIRSNPYAIQHVRYLFIDEFQDINQTQFDIFAEFYKQGALVFAVGDDHQNIYSFRGSSIEYLLKFRDLFPSNSELFKLTYNFRSTHEIIRFANASIERNANQIPKAMIAGLPQGAPQPKPGVRYFETQSQQNAQVVAEIAKLVSEGAQLDEIAVLSPLNHSLFNIEEALVKQGIKNVYLDGKADVRAVKKPGHVCLCTIHKSKGLEWDHVFLTNASDELLPRQKTAKHVEEARRLFYVAVTRAKRRLSITYAAPASTPYVTRFVSELSAELYDFPDHDARYTSGVSDVDTVTLETSVTRLIENLDGGDYAALKRSGVLPTIALASLEKRRLYDPSGYTALIEREELYTDFGTFVDVFASREIARAFGIDARDKYALLTLAAVALPRDQYQIYRAYRSRIQERIDGVEPFTRARVLSALSPVQPQHADDVASIAFEIKASADRHGIAPSRVPVFNDRFLPEDFASDVQSALQRASSCAPYAEVLDDIWDVSKCHAIVKSHRRRLLYMGIKPSTSMRDAYAKMFEGVSTRFVEYLRTEHGATRSSVALHEELASESGVVGEFDLRVGTTIIDFKTSINDEVTAAMILQLLCYKALHDERNPDAKIRTVTVFNPLKGWVCAIDVSTWDRGAELLSYLLEAREKCQRG